MLEAQSRDVRSLSKVLCIENRYDRLIAIRYMLETYGYEVIHAATGEEALNLLRVEDLAGVLLENDLPDGTGAELRPKLKRLKPEVPILLFTGVGAQTPFLLKFFDAYLRDERGDSEMA
jgi:DNA-binding response OmpR family regulator